jgi:hypothetical protein
MTAYTNVAKPTGTPYSNINVQGREQYDQSNLTYDSSAVFYDSEDFNAYVNVAKPVGTSYTNIAKPTT